MGLLGRIFTILSSSFTNIFAYFFLMFGRKFTVATASVLAMLATTTAMIFCLKSILGVLTAAIIMPSWIASAIAMFIPSNFINVVSMILSGKVCKEAYNLVQVKIDLITKAN